jgi:hypothetical protein
LSLEPIAAVFIHCCEKRFVRNLYFGIQLGYKTTKNIFQFIMHMQHNKFIKMTENVENEQEKRDINKRRGI